MIRTAKFITHTALVAMLALVFLSSCVLNLRPRQPKSMLYSSRELSVTPNQIRLHMRALVQPFTGEIEQSADAIAAATLDISVKRAAIRWKIEAVPTLRSALFQPNPFTAVLDTWALTYQMANYFESGPGRAELGPAATRAVNTCLQMEGELDQIVSTFPYSHDVTKVRTAAQKWAIDHPIRYAIRDRESTLSRMTEKDVGVKWTAGEVIGEVEVTADDLNREIQIYSDHLFRQASWEAELLELDLPTSEAFPLAERAVKSSERAVETLDDLAPTIKTAAESTAKAADAATKLASDISPVVASEPKAVVEAINENLRRTLTFLQGERIASLQEIDRERIAVLQKFDDERGAATQDLREIATNERVALSRDIEQAGLRIVDHAAWRLSQLVAVILGSLFLAAVLFLFIVRRLFFSSHQPHQQIGQNPPRAA
jgi:hypothetical protein